MVSKSWIVMITSCTLPSNMCFVGEFFFFEIYDTASLFIKKHRLSPFYSQTKLQFFNQAKNNLVKTQTRVHAANLRRACVWLSRLVTGAHRLAVTVLKTLLVSSLVDLRWPSVWVLSKSFIFCTSDPVW